MDAAAVMVVQPATALPLSYQSQGLRAGFAPLSPLPRQAKLVADPGLLPRLLPFGTGVAPYREVDQRGTRRWKA